MTETWRHLPTETNLASLLQRPPATYPSPHPDLLTCGTRDGKFPSDKYQIRLHKQGGVRVLCRPSRALIGEFPFHFHQRATSGAPFTLVWPERRQLLPLTKLTTTHAKTIISTPSSQVRG